jgi:hypothetical protein
MQISSAPLHGTLSVLGKMVSTFSTERPGPFDIGRVVTLPRRIIHTDFSTYLQTEPIVLSAGKRPRV